MLHVASLMQINFIIGSSFIDFARSIFANMVDCKIQNVTQQSVDVHED